MKIKEYLKHNTSFGGFYTESDLKKLEGFDFDKFIKFMSGKTFVIIQKEHCFFERDVNCFLCLN